MLILKHVKYQIKDVSELEGLLNHLDETTSKMQGITLKDICFPRGKQEFILLLDCKTEDIYLEWREICPPPHGAKDWYEVFLSKEEHFIK
jgi:hypothetical protein